MNSNLTEEEREHVMGLFPRWPNETERRHIQESVRRYIFYETEGRNRRYYTCPSCGGYMARRHPEEDIYITDTFSDSFNYHHKDRFTCPNCAFEGILINVAKAKSMSNLAWEQKIVLLREREGWLLAEAGYARVIYRYDDLVPEADWIVRARYAFKPGKRQKWGTVSMWDAFSHPYEEPHLETVKAISEPFPTKSWYGCVTDSGEYALFGADTALPSSEMRYSMLEEIAGGFCSIYESEDWQAYVGKGAIMWLDQYSGKPALEMLWKVREKELCRDVWKGELHGRKLNFRAKTPWGVYRMDKAKYKALQGMSVEEKIWAKDCELPEGELRLWRDILGGKLIDFHKRYGVHRSAGKIVRWLGSQALRPAYSSVERRYAYWEDMLRMERELGNNTNFEAVLMPEILQERHNEVLALCENERQRTKLMKDRELLEEYRRKRLKKLKRMYEYSDGVLTVAAPESGEEIETEGKLLGHCVAGYAERHLKGVKCVLFLRWADDPDTPYMTIELNEKSITIVQIHGYRNEGSGKTMSPWEIHGEFLDEWLAWIRAGSRRDKQGNPIRNKEAA